QERYVFGPPEMRTWPERGRRSVSLPGGAGPMPGQGRSEVAEHVGALVVFALLSVAATWPTVLHLTTQGLGEHQIDRAQSIWDLWWVKVALLDRHINPFHTDLLFYPQGADLYFHT